MSASRAKARSCADLNRSSGFFSRQCRTTRSSPGERLRLVSANSGGSSFTIAFIVSAADSLWNARFPVSISYSTAPKLKMSERWSVCLPRTCSGDIYPTVPKITQAEIEYLHPPVLGEKEVLRFQV